MSENLRVSVRDFDDVLDVIVDTTITAKVALQYLLSMAAGDFTESVISATVKDFAFEDYASGALFTLRIDTATNTRTRTSG